MQKQIVSAAIVLLMISSLVLSVGGELTPNAEIVDVQYPGQVVAGETFKVNVTIRYSYEGWTLADLGIFHENLTRIFDYVRYYLTKEATRSFVLTVIAPKTPMDLQLKVVTRYWYQNLWVSSTSGSRDIHVEVVGSGEQQISNEWPSIVKVHENEWYYWKNNSSNTCLIWLSGGLAYEDHVTINPYDLETFGAMKYLNDLSQRYSLLALRRGTEGRTIPSTTQTFYALPYYPNSVFLKQLHDWSFDQGYNFTYMVGYSTGGAAAAYEVAVRDPETWLAPNGAIMISAPVEGVPPKNLLESASHVNNLEADIQLLYGEVWSENLWPQGKLFYDNAPAKTSAPWYRKEWHLFPDSSHEVWVKEEDGAHYNSMAYDVTSQFIEKCKSPWRRLSEWNDGSIELYDVSSNSTTGQQVPKTPGASLAAKAGDTLKVKVLLHNCSAIGACKRADVDYIKVDLYSSEGYIDTRYTNMDGYEEFTFTVPQAWVNQTVKVFATLGGEYRDIYTPTIHLSIS